MSSQLRPQRPVSPSAAPVMEPLDPRLLLAVDLTGAFDSLKFAAAEPGERVEIEVDLLNVGTPTNQTAEGSIDFYAFMGPTFTKGDATFLKSISGSSKVPAHFDDILLNLPLGLEAGTYRLAGILDTTLNDPNPANDTFYSDSFLVVAPDYDLVGSLAPTQSHPTSLVAGNAVESKVNVRLTNEAGSTRTIPSGASVRVEVYARPVGAGDDTQDIALNQGFVNASVAGLSPGQSRTVEVPVRFPEALDEGEYNLVVVVDGTGRLTESDEGNNETVDAGVITVASAFIDLEPTILGSSTIPADLISGDGTKTTLRVAVHNHGNTKLAKSARAQFTVTAVPDGGGTRSRSASSTR